MARKKEDALKNLKSVIAGLDGRGKDVIRVIASVVKSVKELKAADADKAEAMQEVGAANKRIEELYGLNRKAVKALLAFSKMDDAKKSDYLRTLIPGLEAMMPKISDLFADTAQPDSEEADQDAKDAGKTPMEGTAAARQAAQAAPNGADAAAAGSLPN